MKLLLWILSVHSLIPDALVAPVSLYREKLQGTVSKRRALECHDMTDTKHIFVLVHLDYIVFCWWGRYRLFPHEPKPST